MDHYIEMRIRLDPEFSPNVLLSALLVKLHRALVQHGKGDIGISFPEVDEDEPTLGQVLRLHGAKATLLTFMGTGWFRSMHDYLGINEIATAPINAEYRIVRRVQAKTNVERLRRRHMKRHRLSEAQAREKIPDTAIQRLHLPCVHMVSTSTGQPFPLFIQHGALTHEVKKGIFNSYGLSATATIPWF